MKTSRIFDVVLVLVIIGSGVYIGSRFMSGESSQVESKPTGISTDAPLPANAISLSGLDPSISAIGPWGVPYGIGGQLLMAKTKKFEESDWAKLVESDALKKLRRTETDTCASRLMPVSRGLSVVLPDLIKKIETGEAQFHIAPFTSYCSKVGDRFEVLKFSEVPNEPYVQHVGSVQVLDILQGKMSDFPVAFFERLGLTPDELLTALRGRSNVPDLPISVFRYGKFEGAKSNAAFASRPVPNYFRYPVLDRGDLAQWAGRLKNGYRVVDVRSEEEARKNPLPGAISAPFAVAGSASGEKFSWSVTVSELDRAKFDISTIQTTVREQPVLVVGASKEDGRPLWALRELLRAGINISWYYEGAAALAEESKSLSSP